MGKEFYDLAEIHNYGYSGLPPLSRKLYSMLPASPQKYTNGISSTMIASKAQGHSPNSGVQGVSIYLLIYVFVERDFINNPYTYRQQNGNNKVAEIK